MKYEIKFKFKNSSFLSIVEDMNPKRFDGSWQAMPSITNFLKIDQITKFAKIAKYQMAIFVTSFQVIYNYSAFGCSFVTVSLVRENPKGLRENLKHKFLSPVTTPIFAFSD